MLKRIQMCLAAAFLLSALAWAPVSQAAAVDAQLKHGQAQGEAIGEVMVSDLAPDKKEILVDAAGLRPNSVYTVWFANDEAKELGAVGTGDHSFRSDENGNGQYRAVVTNNEFNRWESLIVAFHPDGDPGKMETMEIEMEADLGEIG